MLKKSALLLASVLMVASFALAQEANELEKLFAETLKQAAPKTVLVRNAIPGTKRQVSGSGAVISSDGLIITCSHVVHSKDSLTVTFPDGKTYKAKLLGQNYVNDYALLKIEAKGLPYFELGESGKLKVGQPTMALGYPGGQCKDNKPWIGYGKVVALKRNVPVQGFERFYVNAIKTGIKSVPGNSGGPLVAQDGKLVGINGAVMIFINRTYAIPIDAIKEALPTLKAGKDVEGTGVKDFGKLMKELQNELTPGELKKFYEELGKRLRETDPKKLFENFKKLLGEQVDVKKVIRELEKLLGDAKGGLAEAAKGLLGEEAFKELEKEIKKLFEDKEALKELGREVEKALKEFEKLFGGGEEEKKPEKKEDVEPPEGDELDREIDRMLDLLKKRFGEKDKEESEQEEVKKKVKKLLDEEFGKPREEEVETPRGGPPYVGVRVSEASDALRYQLNLEGGLLVEEVKTNSPADKAGLRAGDVIVAVSGKSTASFDDFAGMLEGKKPGDKLKMTVVARGRKIQVVLKLEAK